MSELKLISVDFLYNYVEEGDKLFITATWENIGDNAPGFDASIVADIVFSEHHRLEGGQCSNYSIFWKPFPSTFMWKKGDIWSTTGVWQVTAKWGGSYDINLSLKDENGKNISFIGKDGAKTYSQFITAIDIGWGWGRPRLLEQRKPLSIKINEAESKVCVTELPYENFCGFKLNKNYIAVCGFENENWNNFPCIVTLRKISDNSILRFIANNGIEYRLTVDSENKIRYTAKNSFCSFDLEIVCEENNINMQISSVKEADGYEFISLEIPSLIQVHDENASLINYFGGGRKISVNGALPQTADFYFDACNALGAVSQKGSFAVIANDVDNVLKQSVIRKNANENSGVIGVLIRNYIKADKAGMKSIPVKTRKLEIHYSDVQNPMLSAEILRKKLPDNFEKLYENTLLYKIRVDASGQYNPERPETYSPIITLAEVEKIIKQVYEISGGMKQVVYIVGWQKGGHDFEYPYPYLTKFNPQCGSLEEFNSLRVKLKNFNVELSLHDNFDDAYLSETYEIKKDMLCVNNRGEYWKGWLWAGGMSYIISPTAYLETPDITERIEASVKDYGIENTYHLDVLSSEVRRYSFAENELSSAQDNIESKLKIIELFNRKGIDITSETLSLPFIGKMGYAQNTRYNFGAKQFINEEILPLTTVAFHGVTPYKMGADGSETGLLRAIACGASCSIEIEDNTDSMTAERNMARNIYIVSMPMSMFSYKKSVGCKIQGNKWTVEYEDNSYVTADFDSRTYTVVSDGKIISENFTTFMPLSQNRYCYFSMRGAKAELKLPDGWKNVLVSKKNSKVCSFEIINGVLSFEAEADTPYFIEKQEN